MANSAWWSTSNSNIEYRIVVIQGAQSITNNTTSVTVEVWVRRTNTGYTTYGSGTVYCEIAGVSFSQEITTSQKITSEAIKVFSRSMVITHNADGTKTLNTSARINHSQFTSTSNSYSEALPTIPRKTQVSVDKTTAELGTAVVFSMPRASSGFTHKLTAKVGTTTTEIGSGLGTNKSFTLPLSWASTQPNASTGSATVTCTTYSGAAVIGTSTITIKWTIPASVVPTIDSFSLTGILNGVPSAWGLLLSGISGVKALASASGAYGSRIVSYEVIGGGYKSSARLLETGAIAGSGNISFKVTAVDSRGRTAVDTKTIYITAYTNPSVTITSAKRCTSAGVDDPSGRYLKIRVTDTYSTLGGSNAQTRVLEFRRRGTSAWTSLGAYTRNTEIVVGTNQFSPEYTYQVRATFTDSFSTVYSTVNVASAFVTMDFRDGGKGIAFGKTSEKDGFEIAMPLFFSGGACPHPIGTILMTSNNTNPHAYYLGSVWEYMGRESAGYINSSSSNRIEAGRVDFGTIDSGAVGSVTVTFKVPFYLNPPAIIITPATGAPQGRSASAVATTTGFTAYLHNASASALTGAYATWVAVAREDTILLREDRWIWKRVS